MSVGRFAAYDPVSYNSRGNTPGRVNLAGQVPGEGATEI